MRSRCGGGPQRSWPDLLAVGLGELFRERSARRGQGRARRAFGDAEDLGDLPLAEVRDVAEDDGLTLAEGEGGDGSPDGGVWVGPLCGRGTAAVEEPTLEGAAPAAAARLVQRDPVDPAGGGGHGADAGPALVGAGE